MQTTTNISSAPSGVVPHRFVLDDWARLNRILILGSDASTLRVGADESADGEGSAWLQKWATPTAVSLIERCVMVDGLRVVRTVVAISDAGRAPKNDPAIVALAVCMKRGNDETRKAAREALPKVCRIGTHLHHLVSVINLLGGFGRGTKRALAEWYTERSTDSLAMQLVKYQSRDGWSHRDVLRLAKPHGHERGGDLDRLLGWATRKVDANTVTVDGGAMVSGIHPLVDAFEAAKRSASPEDTVRLIRDYGLPRECVRSEHLNDPRVWEALLLSGDGMPMTAMLRNLTKMGSVKLLTLGSEAASHVVSRLTDRDVLRRSRVHPLAILMAYSMYRTGYSLSRGGTITRWDVIPSVCDALDAAFYLCFQNVEPTDARWALGLDVSGSMNSGLISGLPGIKPRVATAAMAMITTRTEKECYAKAFTTTLTDVRLNEYTTITDAATAMNKMPFGATDCSLLIMDALNRKIPVDVFVTYTDSETNTGGSPAVALRKYREAMGIDAKHVVVGFTATNITIADPNDPGMLDVVGFDTATPAIMSEFVRGAVMGY